MPSPPSGSNTPHQQGAAPDAPTVADFGLLTDVSEWLWSSPQMDDVLHRALRRVTEHFGGCWAVVQLWHLQGEREATVRAAFGPAPDDAGLVLADAPRDVAPATGAPVFRGAAISDGGWPSAWGCRWLMTAPVIAGREVVGVIRVASAAEAGFSSAGALMLAAIGKILGAAAAHDQTYQRILRAKMEWEQASDAMRDAIALFGADLRTMRVNLALARGRGWRITETQGRTCAEVGLCGGGCPNCLVGEALRNGQRIDRELLTDDGRQLAVTVLPVPGPDSAVVLIAKDVTEDRQQARRFRELSDELHGANRTLVSTLDQLRRAQAQLIQAEKLSAIGTLVAGVAHEINNPLTTIGGFGELVLAKLASEPALAPANAVVSGDIACIVSECERAAAIVRNLLSFARLQPAGRSWEHLDELCERVLALRAHEHRRMEIDVVRSFAPGLPRVSINVGQIQQVLLNLIVNAEHALRDRPVKRLEIDVRPDPACSALRLTVRDSGGGIDTVNLHRVFDPFFTTKRVGEGTGLGLSIAYGIVRDHGGQVWAESQRQAGATFSVRLPIPIRPAGSGRAPAALVACTESVSRDFLAAVLRGWGLEVSVASTLTEAARALVSSDLSLVCADDAMVALAPERWRDLWTPLADRASMVRVAPQADTDVDPFLAETARAAIIAPEDLGEILAVLPSAG